MQVLQLGVLFRVGNGLKVWILEVLQASSVRNVPR